MIPLPTIMKQIKQISPAEAFTGILLGDHLSCNLIKFLITGGSGLRHWTFFLHTSLLLLLLHFTQVDILQPDQVRLDNILLFPDFPWPGSVSSTEEAAAQQHASDHGAGRHL